MADVIDDLKIQIDASTQSADAKLDKFINKMLRLQSAISGVEMSGASQVASGINQISSAIQGFSERTKTADFSRVVTGMNKLAQVDSQGVFNSARAMESFSSSMMGIRDIHFDSQSFSDIANAISKLGRASVTEATQNLQSLKTSVVEFVSGMNGVGALNFDPAPLANLVSAVSRMGGKNTTQAVQNLPQLSTYLRDFIVNMNSAGGITFNFDGLANLVDNIARLGGAKATQAAANLQPIKDQLMLFVNGLNGIGALNFDTTGLANLVSAISRLGGKAATTAIPNIKQLSVALSQMMATLSKAPLVSQNLIQMTNALANLASNGSRVSTASQAMQKGLHGYSGTASKAGKSTKGLVSQIGMFYARCFLLVRGVKALWKSTKSAMDYIETLNYFDAAWKQVADNAVGDWKSAGYDSAEAYAASFGERAKSLTGKMTGFQPDESGNLVATGMPSLGLDPEKLMNYQATFGQMASSMGVASETSLKLSNALTMIGADLASVKNLKFEDVWQDMASGMVGMSRTLDKYGVNIRNVNMQEKLAELGINAKITALNQQDKALLRTIILLQSTKYAWGDMADTIGQPANQLRLLQANFANLARTIGGLFLPIVSKVLPYINALVIALQRLFSWIGSLLGIKVGGFSSSIGSAATDFGDMEDAADGIADSTGEAAKNTKKMAANLQSFDKLNVINSKDDSGGGEGSGGGGTGGLLDDAFADAFDEYQAAWENAFANMENSAQQMADRVQAAFQKVWEAAEPTREALKRLWDEGLAQLGNFTWTALQDFWNEFLVPVGQWTLGTGLPMLIDSINDFLMKIDFAAINEALRNFWEALVPFATNVGEGLIEFFHDLLSVGADFINYIVPNGLNGIAEALKKIDPETAKSIGYAFGVVATALTGLKMVGSVVSFFEFMWKFFTDNKIVDGAVALGKGISGITEAFKVLKAGGLLEATGFFSKLADAFALTAGGAGTLKESLTLMFGPIGTTIAGIIGVVTGACMAITNFVDMLKDGFSWAKEALMVLGIAITAVGAIILGAPALITGVIAAIVAAVGTIIVVVKDNWDSICVFFSGIVGWIDTNMIQPILGFFRGLWDDIKGIWEEVSAWFSENVIDPAIAGFKDLWSTVKGFFKSLWGDIKGIWKSASGWFSKTVINPVVDFFKRVWTDVKGYFQSLWDNIKGIWDSVSGWFSDNVIDPIVSFFEGFKTRIEQVFEGLWIIVQAIWIIVSDWFNEYVITPVVDFFKGLWTTVQGFFSSLWEDIKGIWSTVSTWFNNNVIAPVSRFFENLWSTVKGFFSSLWEDIKGIWASVSTWFNDNVVVPISQFFEELWPTIKGFFSSLWDDIKGIWSSVSSWFNENVIVPISGFFEGMWTKVKGFFQSLWDDVKGIWDKVSTWFDDNVIQPITKAFEGLWSGIKSGVVSAMNAVIGGIEKGINFIIGGINDIISGFNRVVSWAADIAEVEWDGVDIVPTVQLPRVPQFANGGFPEDGLFMANHNELIGQFSNGRSVVANNEQITAGIAIAVQNANREQNGYLNAMVGLLEVIKERCGITDSDVFESAQTVQGRFNAKTNRTGWSSI